MASLYPEQQLKRRVMAWAIRMKVNPQQVVITQMPDKWGFCTSEGVVTFSDELAETDAAFQDYVIVHELLHLRFPNHGKRFKALLGAYLPDWKRLDAEVREQSRRVD